jgi:NDP-4-keto-2,6-dideoxyhexose 3-C-methyltransferase
MIYATRSACRLCGDVSLDEILGLGELAFSAFPERSDQRIALPAAPLTLLLCRCCGLAQLRQTVLPEHLYRKYWYRSAINETMRDELQSIVRAALLDVSVYSGSDLVMDVGANDGYLLSQYPPNRINWNVPRIAFEPAANLEGDCRQHCEIFSAALFPPAPGVLWDWRGRVKILTSIAMFYDLDDPGSFVKAVDLLLHKDGVWIVQLQDLAQMVECTAFDNLCHEHLTYWSLAAFETLLRSCGVDLHVVKAERRPINGGSLRITIRRGIYAADPSVEALTGLERPFVDWQALERFAWNTTMVRRQIQGMVGAEATNGKTIDLYGASTKANTLLQYCQLGPETIRQAWERNTDKFGRLTATGIPIVSEAVGRQDPPRLLLVGIWQFRGGILDREYDYLAGGGRMLFPLPEVDLVGHAPPDV